ncbi:hypothetical protein ABVK25_011865 [Lepraria finkii]|uniref:Acyl-CoA N-acyltransferase n=1 Tax=Lepraria finkii TaxID=1340010 RepID=A0ABR4AMD8_9LECA
MADEVDVTPASPEDIPTIASIWLQTMRTNPVMDFVFSNHLYGSSAPRKYVPHMYEQAFRQGTSHFAKATYKETCEMVGYMSFRVEDGKGNDKQNSKAPYPLLKDADLELYDMYFGGRARKEKKHVSSCQRQHYTCNHRSSAHVPYNPNESPRTTSHTNAKGIGSALLRYGLSKFHLDKLPIFVVTTIRGQGICRKFCWKDVDYVDVNLAERAGPDLGYGMHRSPCMLDLHREVWFMRRQIMRKLK